MSTHVPVLQSFFRIFASFCIGQISHHNHKVKWHLIFQHHWLMTVYICRDADVTDLDTIVPLESTAAYDMKEVVYGVGPHRSPITVNSQ